MNDDVRTALEDLKVDTTNLYKEEMFTDMKVAQLKQMIPVNTDGTRDLGRKVIYMGQTQVLSQMGPIPVSCNIEAGDLSEALAKFPEAVKVAVAEMLEELREMQRKEASRIVVPGADTASKILGG